MELVKAYQVAEQSYEDELKQRKEHWKKPSPNYTSGALAKYASLVGSASNGAITKPANI